MDQDWDQDQEEMTVTLTLDDGSEVECVVLTIFRVNEQEYIALLPMDGEEDEEGDVYLYSYAEGEDENPVLSLIDEEEYEAVAEAFDAWLDGQEYDEWISEDEL